MEGLALLVLSLIIGIDWYHKRGFSAASIFILLNGLSLALGYHFYGVSTEGASIELDMSIESLRDVYLDALKLVVCFGFGRAITSGIFTNAYLVSQQQNAARGDVVAAKWVIPFSIVSITLFIVGSGAVELFWRATYMVETSQIIKSIANVGSLASPYLLGVCSALEKSSRRRSVGMLVCFVIVFAGYSTRMLALAPLLFFFGHLSHKRSASALVGFLIAIMVAPVLLYLVLFMRGQAEQGLIPLVSQLFKSETFNDFSFGAVFNNAIAISFVVTGLTAILGQIDTAYMLTSLNPMPGFLTDWYEIAGGLNGSTPFSMMGEWISYGIAPAVAFYICLGCLYEKIDIEARKGDVYFSTVGIIVMNLSTLNMLQYQTRYSTRLIYYVLVGRAMLYLIGKYIRPLFISYQKNRAVSG